MCHRRQKSQADDQELRQFTWHRPAVRRLSPGARPSRGGGRGCCRPRTSSASSTCRRTPCAYWCRTASGISLWIGCYGEQNIRLIVRIIRGYYKHRVNDAIETLHGLIITQE